MKSKVGLLKSVRAGTDVTATYAVGRKYTGIRGDLVIEEEKRPARSIAFLRTAHKKGSRPMLDSQGGEGIPRWLESDWIHAIVDSVQDRRI